MGQNGEDILLSQNARKIIPFSIECKASKKGFTKIYDAIGQAVTNANGHTPLVVIKQDRQKPLVVVDAEWFFRNFQ